MVRFSTIATIYLSTTHTHKFTTMLRNTFRIYIKAICINCLLVVMDDINYPLQTTGVCNIREIILHIACSAEDIQNDLKVK